MHGLADEFHAAEGKGNVAHSAADSASWTLLFDAAGGLDEGHSVSVVLLDSGGDSQDVGIEDDVVGIEADAIHQQFEAADANLHFAFHVSRLAFVVKGHDHYSSAKAADERSFADEIFLSFLQRNGIDDALALTALETGLDNAEIGRVDTQRHLVDTPLTFKIIRRRMLDRYLGNVRFRRNQVDEARHGSHAIQHSFVHVLRRTLPVISIHADNYVATYDIQDLGSTFHLFLGHG